MSTEIIISLALVFACVVLILIHPRGREASIAVGAAIALYWMTRKKPAPVVPPAKIEPPEINYAETHKMDDDVTPRPAATHSAQQLRDWAKTPRDNVRHEE